MNNYNVDKRIALMFDAENVSPKYIDDIMTEVTKYGRLVIARLYGDINHASFSDKWREKALVHSIKPMHQFQVSSAKNAADMEMALDVLELRYQNKADIFFIVSSDSDFRPLAIRLKESGAMVVGIGDANKVTDAYKNACNEFKYFQYFDEDELNSDKTTELDIAELKSIITNIIIETGENNQLALSRLGDILVNRYSDFDPRKYGSSNLTSLVKKHGFETETHKTTTVVKYSDETDLNDIKKFIEKQLGAKKSGVLGKLINDLNNEFPDFNYKSFGYSRFNLFIKSLGYDINKNSYTKK